MPPWTLTNGADRTPHRARALTMTAVIGGAVLLSGFQADGVVPGGSSPPVDANAKPQLADPDGLVSSHTFLLPAPDRDIVPSAMSPSMNTSSSSTSTRTPGPGWFGPGCRARSPRPSRSPESRNVCGSRSTVVRRCWRKPRRVSPRRTSSSSISPSQRLRQPRRSTSASADRHPEERQGAAKLGHTSPAWQRFRWHVESCTLLAPP